MSIEPGTHPLGPDHGTLYVRTGRTGAASKAGHDLMIEVTSWQATLEVGEDPAQSSVQLSVDGGSLRVREGSGGIQALGDEDRAGIKKTIDDDVLKGTAIRFHSDEVQAGPDGDVLSIRGGLELAGRTRPIAFELSVGDGGRLSASVKLKQTDWEIKPYSTLFGALKVLDEVEVVLQASLPSN
ncbi:MAG: YceI family protein [Solirubrobacteraceae bacterium]